MIYYVQDVYHQCSSFSYKFYPPPMAEGYSFDVVSLSVPPSVCHKPFSYSRGYQFNKFTCYPPPKAEGYNFGIVCPSISPSVCCQPICQPVKHFLVMVEDIKSTNLLVSNCSQCIKYLSQYWLTVFKYITIWICWIFLPVQIINQ